MKKVSIETDDTYRGALNRAHDAGVESLTVMGYYGLLDKVNRIIETRKPLWAYLLIWVVVALFVAMMAVSIFKTPT